MASIRTLLDAFRRFVGSHDEGVDLTDYVTHLERAFSVTLAPGEVASVFTLGDMTDLVARKVGASGRAVDRERVWPEVRRITSHEMGVAEGELHEGIRYVEDLRC